MKKIRKPLILFAFTATAICGLGFASSNLKSDVNEVSASVPSTTYPVIAPEVYYEKLDDSGSGTDFLSVLRTFNMSNRKTNISYSSLNSYFCYTDYDPATVKYDVNNQPYGTSLLSFYSGKSTTSYNKEHVWPNSRGGGSDKGKSGSPYVEDDIFMPRPTISAENSDRGNSSYVEGMCHSSNGWDPVTAFEKTLGVYQSIRGECARIIFYCMTVNPNLKLVDDANTDFSGVGGRVTMGKLSDMLRWNLENPVNEREINRNNGGQYIQGNRNAFVDHPEYACKIWGNTNDATKKICQSSPTPTKVLDKITVTGTPSKVSYKSGENFSTTGLTVTATYDDKSTENVTSKVTVSPSPLTKGTTSVTLLYTYGDVTKTATVSGITVSDPAPSNYGTLENPLSVSEARLIIEDECRTSGAYTKQELYVKGKAGSTITNYPDSYRKKIYVHGIDNVASTLTVESLNMTKQQYDALDENDEIIFHGYGYNSNNADYIKFKDSSNPTLDKNITKEVPVSDVTIDNLKTDYHIGDTAQIQTTILPTTAYDKTLTYSSNNEAVATVSSTGLVTFIGAGSVTITAASINGINDTITFNVTKLVTDIVCSLPSTNYYVGDTATLGFVITPSDAPNKEVYFTSNNSSVATIDRYTGSINFLKEGKVTLQVVHTETMLHDEIDVTVLPKPVVDIPVTNIFVTESSVQLDKGEEYSLSYTVLPSDATNKNVTWSSSNTSVVTVENGVVKAINPGNATVTVTSVSNKEVSCTIPVNVKEIVPEIIHVQMIQAPKTLSLKVDEDVDINYTVLPTNATDKSVTFSSSNEEVATVDSSGNVVAVSDGTAKITITSNDNKEVTAEITVTVSSTPKPANKLVEIVVERTPNKTVYSINEPFDSDGILVAANYLDGTKENITHAVRFDNVDTSTEGEKTVVVRYGESFKTEFHIIVSEAEISELKVVKYPLKTHYFVDEEFNPLGMVVEAKFGNKVVDVTNSVSFDYEFERVAQVTVEYQGLTAEIFVTIETGEITNEHKAADFAYVVKDVISTLKVEEVTLQDWYVLQHYYNTLDDGAKKVLQEFITKYSGAVSAAEVLTDTLRECAEKYDEIYLAHKNQGFEDFMKRSPKAPDPTPTPDPKNDSNLPLILGIVGGVVGLAVVITIIAVAASKKRKKKHA